MKLELSPFPPNVRYTLEAGTYRPDSLLAEERLLLSPQARELRQQSFIRGRIAARRALQQLGLITPPPILRSNRLPSWPPGFLGSISHTSEVAVAACARSRDYSALGIDVEAAQTDFDPSELISRVCHPSEISCLQAASELTTLHFICLFSLREAFYKAFYPQIQTFLPYQAVQIDTAALPQPDGPDSQIDLQLLEDWGHLKAGFRVQLGCGLRSWNSERQAAPRWHALSWLLLSASSE